MKKTKKIFAFLVALSTVFCSFVYVGAVDEVDRNVQTITMLEKNLVTGEEEEKTYEIDTLLIDALSETENNFIVANENLSSSLSLSSTNSMPSEYTQVTNTEARPYSAIGFLRTKWKNIPLKYGYATAFLISDNVALTSAHVIYDKETNDWVKSGQFYPGKNGFGVTNDPYGATYFDAMAVCTQYIENTDLQTNSCYDWGVIRLHEGMGNKCGILSLANMSTGDLLANTVISSGYPQPSSTINYCQYEVSGTVLGCQTERIFLSFTGVEGMSGAPIIASNGSVCAIASEKVSGGIYATKITDTVIGYLNQYIAENS